MAQPAYWNEDVLRELYWDKDMSIKEIAEKFDVGYTTIHSWMKENNVERRTACQNKPVHHRIDNSGYEIWETHSCGTHHSVRVHRLQMVAEEGIEAVKGMEVHHKNTIKWDNRPSNLELLTSEEHTTIHADMRRIDVADISDQKLRKYIYGQQMTVPDIVDEEDCKKLAVKRCVEQSPVWKRYIPQTDHQVVVYVVENHSVSFAADYFDITEQTVNKRLRDANRSDLIPKKRKPVDEKYDREKLRSMYHDMEMNMSEIADEISVSDATVSQIFNKLDIETRSRGPERGCHQSDDVKIVNKEYPWRDKELLYSEYVERNHGYRTLARAWDTNRDTIRRWVEKFDFEKNDPTDYVNEPWHDKNMLYELYIEQDMTLKEVGNELGCSTTSVKKWIDRHDIST